MSKNPIISGKAQSLKDTEDDIFRTAQISWMLRQKLRASLPVSDEQFLTVMVPGKVINFEDYINPGTSGEDSNAIKDIGVQVREAMLVNDLPATSGVQLGPTGRSISNSYAAALDLLVPSGSTIGVDRPPRPDDPHDPHTRFQTAMEWLSTTNNNGESRIDLYGKYQRAHCLIVQERASAYANALKESRKLYPGSEDKANDHYMNWVQEHYKVFNNRVQAAYMAWVVHGEKEKVEYNFALVDVSSANERIEQSKQSMRDSVVATADGSAEFNRVYLEPSNWAFIAKQKAIDTLKPAERTADEIQFEINRLKFKRLALEASGGLDSSQLTADVPTEDLLPLTTAINETLMAARKYDEKHKEVIKHDVTSAGTGTAPSEKQEMDALVKAREHLVAEQNAYTARASAQLQLKVAHLADHANTSASTTAGAVQERIAKLEDELAHALENNKAVKNSFSQVFEDGHDDTVKPTPAAAGSILPDYWTRITCEVESSHDAAQKEDHSTSYSVGGSTSWGAFSIGGSYSHADASGRAARQMSKVACTATFDVMRVDITRPWLRADLFYDSGLDAGQSAKLSPGPLFLRMLIDATNEMPTGTSLPSGVRERALKTYSLFPHYSTAFLLAANIVLELKGETSDIASYFHSEQTSASARVGWGPFSAHSSYHHSSSKQSSSYETTSEGGRITIKAPQIIGWVSQILPALPRIPEGETPFTVKDWTFVANRASN